LADRGRASISRGGLVVRPVPAPEILVLVPAARSIYIPPRELGLMLALRIDVNGGPMTADKLAEDLADAGISAATVREGLAEAVKRGVLAVTADGRYARADEDRLVVVVVPAPEKKPRRTVMPRKPAPGRRK
jgi:hypothetical protein